ncbi:MAG: hypothetical protein MJ153_07795 [Clostridia bacterium]|nr:hypothetical protein [Clostridia bacterium]
MGYGSYTATDWNKLKASRKIETSSTNQIFTARQCDSRYDPKFIGNREARDSEEHPLTTPIIIGVDVTGSMGYLSTQIIKESLNDLMQQFYSGEEISDPQLMFAAIGDAVCDSAPLQVTHFESDIRIAEQLMDLWLENRGGDIPEDYELLWYFAAKHTDIDSYNKRGKKGFCFTIGDAGCHELLNTGSIKRIFDDDVKFNISSVKLAESASEKYELFHIVIGDQSFNFDRILPGRIITIQKKEVIYLTDVIMSVIQYVNGTDKDTILSRKTEVTRTLIDNVLNSICINRFGTIEL